MKNHVLPSLALLIIPAMSVSAACWIAKTLPTICCPTPSPRDCGSRDAHLSPTATPCPNTNNGTFPVEDVRGAEPGESGGQNIAFEFVALCVTQPRKCVAQAPWCEFDGLPVAGETCLHKRPAAPWCSVPPPASAPPGGPVQ